MPPQDVSSAILRHIKTLLTVETLVSLLVRVANFVRLQTAVAHEAPLAQIAPVDLLPGMRPHVLLIAVVGFEPCITLVTFVRAFVGVNPPVPKQIRTGGASFRAEFAEIPVVSGMFVSHVLPKITFVLEESPTGVADEWSGGMGLQVCLKRRAKPIAGIALITSERLFQFVQLCLGPLFEHNLRSACRIVADHMNRTVRLRCVLLLTLVTNEDRQTF